MKAFCLAFAFLLASLPAIADELPQTGNAWRATEPDLAEPGTFQWSIVDDAAGGGKAPAAAGVHAEDKNAPARAALAQIKSDSERVMDEARKNSAKVSRIVYDLRVHCLIEQADAEADALAEAGMPYIWGAPKEKEPQASSLQMCAVDYTRKVRTEVDAKPAQEPHMVGFNIALPAN